MLMIGLGIIFRLIISTTSVFTEGSSFSIYGKDSRFTSLPAIGLGFLVCYLFSSCIPSMHNTRLLTHILFALLILFNLKGLHDERLAYIKSWDIQNIGIKSIIKMRIYIRLTWSMNNQKLCQLGKGFISGISI